jgi:hypothetical protein
MKESARALGAAVDAQAQRGKRRFEWVDDQKLVEIEHFRAPLEPRPIL